MLTIRQEAEALLHGQKKKSNNQDRANAIKWPVKNLDKDKVHKYICAQVK